MPVEHESDAVPQLRAALGSSAVSTRLQVALAAGTRPARGQVEVLVERCAVEPDFYVRDMLTWALTRHDLHVVVELLIGELGSEVPQARSQALHSLSKLKDERTWPFITDGLLRDPDDQVARAAWRAAVVLVPDEGTSAALAETLATQLGRGDVDTQLSLSRALVELGPSATTAVKRGARHHDLGVRAHAVATQRLAADPSAGFPSVLHAAQREVALVGVPTEQD